MVKKLLIPFMVLAVCVAAKSQRVSSTVSSRSYSGTVHSSSGSSGFSSRPTASYSSSARYSSSSMDRSSGTGYRSYSSSTPGSDGQSAFARSYGDRTRSDAYQFQPFGGQHASFGEAVLVPAHMGYLSMEPDKYSLAVLPKTVPFSGQNPQREGYISYGASGGTGSGAGGVWVNPFSTPGFSSCSTVDDSHYYQIQFLNFVQGRSLYGFPRGTLATRRYIYWNYWRSGLSALCQESLLSDLARAKTPAEIVEVMRSYHRCLRTIDGDLYYDRLYPHGWGR